MARVKIDPDDLPDEEIPYSQFKNGGRTFVNKHTHGKRAKYSEENSINLPEDIESRYFKKFCRRKNFEVRRAPGGLPYLFRKDTPREPNEEVINCLPNYFTIAPSWPEPGPFVYSVKLNDGYYKAKEKRKARRLKQEEKDNKKKAKLVEKSSTLSLSSSSSSSSTKKSPSSAKKSTSSEKKSPSSTMKSPSSVSAVPSPSSPSTLSSSHFPILRPPFLTPSPLPDFHIFSPSTSFPSPSFPSSSLFSPMSPWTPTPLRVSAGAAGSAVPGNAASAYPFPAFAAQQVQQKEQQQQKEEQEGAKSAKDTHAASAEQGEMREEKVHIDTTYMPEFTRRRVSLVI